MQPPHPSIVGRTSKYSSPEVRKRRDEYIVARIKEGYFFREIGDALGISENAVGGHAQRLGVRRPQKPPTINMVHRLGISFGHMTKAYNRVPDGNRDQLISEVARSGLTVSEYLVQFWLERRDKV